MRVYAGYPTLRKCNDVGLMRGCSDWFYVSRLVILAYRRSLALGPSLGSTTPSASTSFSDEDEKEGDAGNSLSTHPTPPTPTYSAYSNLLQPTPTYSTPPTPPYSIYSTLLHLLNPTPSTQPYSTYSTISRCPPRIKYNRKWYALCVQ